MGASFVVEDKSVGLDYSFSLPLEIEDNSGSHRIQMVFRFSPPKELVLPENLDGIKVPLRQASQTAVSPAEEKIEPAQSENPEDIFPEDNEPATSLPAVFEPAPVRPKKSSPKPLEAVSPKEEILTMDEEIRKMEEEILGETVSPAKVTPAVKAKAGAHFNKATELYKQGSYEEAISEWQKVLKLNPSHELSKQKIRKTRSLLDSE